MSLDDRIAGALRLAPMTAAEVARCLSAPLSTVRHRIADMHETGALGTCGHKRHKHGAPARRFVVMS